ncbi:hypothetical protein ACTQ1N_04350 [Porcincola sp. LCP21S3_C12]|uniref:hypothetical protein n=1 Tax=Porcincola sp. LCP21S3_C12 TaxID=3438798 RepID=UPI003F9AD086
MRRIRTKTKQLIREKTKSKTRSDRQAALLRRQEDDEASVGRQMPLVVKGDRAPSSAEHEMTAAVLNRAGKSEPVILDEGRAM